MQSAAHPPAQLPSSDLGSAPRRSGWLDRSPGQRLAAFLLLGLAGVLVGAFFQPGWAAAENRQDDDQGQTRVLPALSAGGTADSNGSMIAVTGMDVTGQSILYLVDTETKQICVYQASGGSSSTQGIKFVGARRIELDLMLDGFNDKTESSGQPMGFKDLQRMFQARGLASEAGTAEGDH